MNLLKGKKEIVRFKSITIVIDFDELFKNKGEYIYKLKIDHELARIISLIGLIILILPILILLLGGNLNLKDLISPQKLIGCIPYFSIPLFIYSRYLLRNRDEFNGKLKEFNLTKEFNTILFKEDQELVLNNFFSIELLALLDRAYFRHENNFIFNCFNILSNSSTISYLLKERLGVDQILFKKKLLNEIGLNKYSLDNIYQDFFTDLFNEARLLDFKKIDENILFFVLNKYYLINEYRDLNVTELELEGIKIWYKNESKKKEYYKLWKELSKLKPINDINRAYTSKATPLLDTFSEDFTKEAVKGNFITSIGKDIQMKQLLQILERDNNSAVMLLGEAGVGKTRFIHYLATKMVMEDVDDALKDFRLLVIDLNKIFTQSTSIEKFKENISGIFNEAYKSKNIVIVLEEFSQALNVRLDYRAEIVNIIINALNNLKLKIIATSNNSSYIKFVQPFELATEFEVINLSEPESSVSIQILIDEIPSLEKKYKLKIQISALKRIVEYSPKFDFDRVMPDKGIDILEEACITANLQGLKFIDSKLIDEVLSKKIGVKVGEITNQESLMLKNLEFEMHKRIIGQDEAIISVSNAIKRARAGLSSDKKPIASFLFFGPTGVGKTEVAKTLADLYYGDEKFMIRLDMSEYQEEDNLQRLIGYYDSQGNLKGGDLIQSVRAKPFSLILLDEIDKANKKVLDLFLQVLDEGYLIDGINRKISFTNTIIIMTSNVGSKKIANLILEGNKYYDVVKEATEDLREFFRIEFLNRFDKLIMFTPLRIIELKEIIELLLTKLKDKLLQKGINIIWNESTINTLVKLGYNPVNGARELSRCLEENIEDKISKLIIDGKLKSGQEVIFDGITPIKIID